MGSLADVIIVIKRTYFTVKKSIIVLLRKRRVSAWKVVVKRVEIVPKKTMVRKCLKN